MIERELELRRPRASTPCAASGGSHSPTCRGARAGEPEASHPPTHNEMLDRSALELGRRAPHEVAYASIGPAVRARSATAVAVLRSNRG